MCVTCRRYPAKYECDGCGVDHGMYCGHCARPVHVIWIGRVMSQRLCPPCRLSEDEPMRHNIFDARHFTFQEVQEISCM